MVVVSDNMPRDLFIVGAGRSGTSLVAGLFRQSGHYQGSELYPPRRSNPLGFFEDVAVNALNEEILRPFVPRRSIFSKASDVSDIPLPGQFWLARIPVGVKIAAKRSVAARIAPVLVNRPFCLKDPRFCYTLPVWQAQASEARIICVFRHPRTVVQSILREVSSNAYLQSLSISSQEAFEVWTSMYIHVLQNAHVGEWFFVEYTELFKPSVLHQLAEFAEAELDTTFPDVRLDRSEQASETNEGAQEVYDELRSRASQRMQSMHLSQRPSE